MPGGRAGPVADLSPAATTVAFDPILPPLRIPIPAGEDDTSMGGYVLAFQDEDSWKRAWKKSETNILGQCEMGARMGCSISSSNSCRTRWWKSLFLNKQTRQLAEAEREACEDREMKVCLAAAEESCTRYARETCEPVFADARIAEPHLPKDPRFASPIQRKRWAREKKEKVNEDFVEIPSAVSGQIESDFCEDSQGYVKRSTNFRGKKLMDDRSTKLMDDGLKQRSLEGPIWRGGLIETAGPHSGDITVDGWEGGLIRPKLDARNVNEVHTNPLNPSSDCKQLSWQVVEQTIRNLFMNVRL